MSAREPDAKARERERFSLRAGIVVLSRVLGGTAQLVTVMLLVRFMGKVEYGALAFVLLLLQTIVRLISAGVPESVLFFVPKHEGRPGAQKTVVLQSTGILVVLGAAFGALLFAFGGSLDVFGADAADLGPLVPLIALALVLEAPAALTERVLLALDRQIAAAGTSILLQVGTALSTIVPAALGADLETIVWWMVAFSGAKAIALVLVVALAFRGVRGEAMPGGMREQLRYSVPLGLSTIGSFLNAQLDKFIVAIFFTAEVFAAFSVGARELPLVNVLPYTLGAVMLPRMVRHIQTPEPGEDGPVEAVRLWHASIVKTSLVMLPVAVFFFVAAEPFVSVFFTSSYDAAADPFRVYLLTLPLRVTTYGTVVQAFGRSRAVLAATVLALALNAIVSLALLGPLGVLGPPVGTVVSQFFAAWYLLRVIRGAAGARWATVFPWGAYLRVLGVAIVSGAPALGVVALLREQPGLALGAGLAAYAIAYFAVATAAGVLTATDRRYLLALMSPRAVKEDVP